MINEWYKIQVRNLPEATKTWGKRYKTKFEKNLLDVLNADDLFRVEDLVDLAMYLDIEYDHRIGLSLWQLEQQQKIYIFHTSECIYIIKT